MFRRRAKAAAFLFIGLVDWLVPLGELLLKTAFRWACG